MWHPLKCDLSANARPNSTAERCGTHLNATCQPMPDRIPRGKWWIDPHLVCQGDNFTCNIISVTQYDYKNTMINPKVRMYIANPKIQYKYSNNNYIPELLTVNSCWNGVNILASHKCSTSVMYHLSHWGGTSRTTFQQTNQIPHQPSTTWLIQPCWI